MATRFTAADGGHYAGAMPMPGSTPAAEGVDARRLLALLDALETPGHGLHSIMVARHGRVIAEGWWAPYARDRVHLAYSLSKSFTATVLGNLAGRGLINLDAPVWSYLGDLDDLPEKWRRVTVRHCITMTVGHTEDAWDWRGYPDEILPRIVERVPDGEPGGVWAYNQVGTYLVAQVIAAATGEPVTTHVRRLLDRFGESTAKAQRTYQGDDLGFSGMHVTTPSILALAQTWLDGGVWDGDRIVPSDYAAQAPVPTPASLASDEVGDWSYGYGHSFWGQRSGYRGDGAFGQYAIVLPEHDVAVAITSEVETMQDVLDLLWQHLTPAIDAEPDREADAEAGSPSRQSRTPCARGGGASGAAETSPRSVVPAARGVCGRKPGADRPRAPAAPRPSRGAFGGGSRRRGVAGVALADATQLHDVDRRQRRLARRRLRRRAAPDRDPAHDRGGARSCGRLGPTELAP